MDANIHVRPMKRKDLGVVGEIDRISFSEPWPTNTFAYELTTTYSIALVAEDQEGKVIGAIVVWLVVDEAHVATIAVHPDYLHQGVGSALLSSALLVACRRGATSSLLEVRRSNLPALRLYERFGYRIVGVRERYYQNDHEDALLLNLDNLDEIQLRDFLPSTSG